MPDQRSCTGEQLCPLVLSLRDSLPKQSCSGPGLWNLNNLEFKSLSVAHFSCVSFSKTLGSGSSFRNGSWEYMKEEVIALE